MKTLVVFSHLRWDFVYQRPQHLLSRAALDRRVFFIEEPIFVNGSVRHEIHERDNGVKVVVPFLPEGLRSNWFCPNGRQCTGYHDGSDAVFSLSLVKGRPEPPKLGEHRRVQMLGSDQPLGVVSTGGDCG